MVVPANKVNPEHYIFSPFGILHIHPVEGSEAMTLGTWHHHSVLWQQLQLIPFFKYCLLRKALARWVMVAMGFGKRHHKEPQYTVTSLWFVAGRRV